MSSLRDLIKSWPKYEPPALTPEQEEAQQIAREKRADELEAAMAECEDDDDDDDDEEDGEDQ